MLLNKKLQILLMRIDSKGNSWLSISEFNIQCYCEMQLKFIWQGIKIETEKMMRGSSVHNDKFQQFKEQTEGLEEVDIVNAIKRAIEKQERFAGREVFIISPTFRLRGVMDAIEIGPEGIVIADDKPIDYPYLSVKSQLAAYAVAFKDRYRPPLDIFMIVKNRDRGVIIWEDVFSQDWFEFVIEKISRMHELALGKREFEPTANPKKCLSCSYKGICDKKCHKV
jgi:CRISPR/Cas system-associated exonuclease Cas4 (RecB family)